jgi:purine-nucleoside phosphorylase
MRKATTEIVRRLDGLAPKLALVLGSGLGDLVEKIENPIEMPFADLQGFPESSVSGHSGKLVAGTLTGTQVIMLSGRKHYYEQGDAAAMRFPLEVLKEIGISQIILTNAAGSLRDDMPPGSLMMLNDHINYSGRDPLIGEESDARFVPMVNAYDPETRASFEDAASKVDVTLHHGVYMWFSGPSFETPAEIRMAKLLGADAVGMSTVPEVILCRFLGLKVSAFSIITNYGAGLAGGDPSHGETKEMAPIGGERLGRVLQQYLTNLV